jgi:hypothetical protein
MQNKTTSSNIGFLDSFIVVFIFIQPAVALLSFPLLAIFGIVSFKDDLVQIGCCLWGFGLFCLGYYLNYKRKIKKMQKFQTNTCPSQFTVTYVPNKQ